MDGKNTPTDDDFASALEACHEALARRRERSPTATDPPRSSLPSPSSPPPPSPPSGPDGTDPAGKRRLGRALVALQLLERVWPSPDAPTIQGPLPLGEADDETFEVDTPRSFGRFAIRRLIGRGGFAVVYLAHDPQLGKEVALKVPRPDVLVSPEMRRRFFREAEAAAELDHPNIVPVYEVGAIGPAAYITSAFCDGPTLDQWICLRNTPIDERVAAGLVETLALAMQHAHERGVLHRDLKPGNVLLEGGVPRLTDFGLAKLVATRGDETHSGAVLGTPRYMAPEQAQSWQGQVGPRADIYSLGAILYELLTGRPPVEGANDLDTLFRVIWSDIQPVSRFRPDVSRGLEAICLKCLEKKPRHRYGSAAELADDLRRFLDGERTRARPRRLLQRAWRWGTRYRARAALLAVSAAALVALVGTGVRHEGRLRRLLDQAEASRAEADRRGAEIDRRERTLRRYLYAADLKLAHQASQQGDARRVLDYLSRHAQATAGDDLRGFEWHYLRDLCARQRATLGGHGGAVYAIAVSPDGARVATAGADRVVRVWDAHAATLLHALLGHTGDVNVVRFAPDGKILASGSDDETARLWDPVQGTNLGIVSPGAGRIGALAFHPGGTVLALGGTSRAIVLWDLTRNGAAGHDRLHGHADSITALAFHPAGHYLASAGFDQTIRIWDIAEEQERALLAGHEGGVLDLAFDPRGRWLASSGRDQAVRLWDLVTGFERAVLRGHVNWVGAVAFDPEGKTLASAGIDEVVRIWDLDSDLQRIRLDQQVQGHTGRIWSLSFAPDGTLVSGSTDRTARIWRLEDARAARLLPSATEEIRRAAFRPGGRQVATSGAGGGMLLWDLSPGERGQAEAGGTRAVAQAGPVALEGHRHPVQAIAASPDGRYLFSCCENRSIRLWDLARRPIESTILYRPVSAAALEVAPGGQWLAVGCHDGRVLQIAIPSGAVQAQIEAGSVAVRVALAPDGRRIATGRYDGVVEVWETVTGKPLAQRAVHPAPIRAIAFSPDGRRVATAGADRLVGLLELDSARPYITLEGHRDEVRAIAYSPDGRTLASGGLDGSVLLWNVDTNQVLADLDPPLASVNTVAFSDDGRRLLAGGRPDDSVGNAAGLVVIWETTDRDPEIVGER